MMLQVAAGLPVFPRMSHPVNGAVVQLCPNTNADFVQIVDSFILVAIFRCTFEV